jgi:RNA polymerase sigma factor (sigma-70 family)
MTTSSPTRENFEKLLVLLDPDRDRAGERYLLLRLKLIEYFRSRTCLSADELADETLNRLARKIGEGEEIRDVSRYSYGLARWVWMEYRRRPEVKNVTLDDLAVSPSVFQESLVQKERDRCFRHCLRELPAKEREIVIAYWDHEDQPHRDARREMAEKLGISLVALRIRVSRIKEKLQKCFSDCVERGLKK